jgi:hypothetical protein
MGKFKKIFILIFVTSLTKNFNAENLLIDNFNTLLGWQTFGEGIKIESVKGFKDNCIKISYALEGSTEWVVISKEYKKVLPENFKFSFYIKGVGKKNNLEFKLIDKEGNVFWKRFENYEFPKDWSKLEISNEEIEFGWGPNPNASLNELSKIEIGISKGLGGRGEVFVDELFLEELKESKEKIKASVKASSIQEPGLEAEKAFDGNKRTRWSSEFSDPQWLEIDLEEVKELSGLTILWEAAYGKSYEVLLSLDGNKWNKVYSTTEGDGNTDDIYFKPQKARYIKLFCKERGTGWGYSIWEIILKESK